MAKKAKRPNASRSKNNDKARAARVPAKSASNPPAAKQLSSKGETSSNEHRLSVVGVGASAGGLEAFEQLLRALPDDTGMAFVLVQHLAPKHESMLSELLSKTTRMPVIEVREGLEVKPNHVYVIPPNADMSVLNGVLHLTPLSPDRARRMPIDMFFRSLAEDQQGRAIGVI